MVWTPVCLCQPEAVSLILRTHVKKKKSGHDVTPVCLPSGDRRVPGGSQLRWHNSIVELKPPLTDFVPEDKGKELG